MKSKTMGEWTLVAHDMLDEIASFGREGYDYIPDIVFEVLDYTEFDEPHHKYVRGKWGYRRWSDDR